MADNEVTISTKSFDFHYVTKETGEIDGASFFQQTEDAINAVGGLAQEAFNQTTVSAQQIQQALDAANTANTNATNAVATANGAQQSVATLTIQVNGISSQAQQALTIAQSAQSSAQSAVNSANSARDEAEDAKEAAQTAQTAAQNAQSAAQTSAAAAQTAQGQAEDAQQQAEDAQSEAELAKTAAQEAAQQAQEAAINTNIIHAYNGVLSADQSVAIADLVPATGKAGDLIADQNGVLWQVVGVLEGNATVGATGTILTGFISYAQAQTLTEEQQTQSLTNQGVIQAITELITENGGTVPTSLSENSIQTMSEDEADPWADYEE